MPASWQTLILLTLSNVFMTFAWYAHLKDMNNKPCDHRGTGEWWMLRFYTGTL